ncbi:MAG: pitrilysin family protein, partial [Pseudomonadota bacterium]
MKIPTTIFAVMIAAMLAITHARANNIIPEVIQAENGTVGWLVEDKTLPIIALHAVFDGAGAVSDPPGKRGLAYFHNAMLGETSNAIPGHRLRAIQEDLSITLQNDVGRDSAAFGVRTLTRHLQATQDLVDTIFQPDFLQADIARIRGQIQASLARRNTRPGQVAGDHLWQLIFDDTSYAHPPIGVLADINSITREDLQAYHQNMLTRARLRITFVGDIDRETARAWLQRLSDPLRSDTPALVRDDYTPPTQGSVTHVTLPITQDQFAFAHAGPKRDDDDFYAAAIINEILGGNVFSSKLGQEIRETQGLAYNIASDLHPLTHAGLWLGWGASTRQNRDSFIALVKQIWDDVGAGNFTLGSSGHVGARRA